MKPNKMTLLILISITVAVSIGRLMSDSEQATMPVLEELHSTASPLASSSEFNLKAAASSRQPTAQANPQPSIAPTDQPNELTDQTLPKLVQEYRRWTNEALKEKVHSIQDELDDRQWIALANAGQLSADGMAHLAELLNSESAAKLILLEREIEQIERSTP
jgi:hypothetical protein